MENMRRVPTLATLVGRPWFWALFVGTIFSAAILRAVLSEVPDPPRILGQVPTFSLTDQSGQAYGSDNLKGKIWVANFIFTRCTTVCPLFSEDMKELQKRTNKAANGIQLVSFSVDPAHDTPEVLAAYAAQYSANPWYWHFLTGPTDEVRAMVVEGLKTAMGDADEAATPDSLFHGSHFVLVDPDLNLRGFYDVNDEETMDRILVDIQLVITEQS